MKTWLFTLALLALSTVGFAQKFAAKRNLVTVDGQPYFRFESDGNGSLYLLSLQNERLLVVKEMLLNDPAIGQAGNSSNALWYLQYVFLKPHTIVETLHPPVYANLLLTVARTLYTARLLQDNTVSQLALAEFSLVNGTVYSDRRQALNQLGGLPLAAPATPVISPPQSPRTLRP